MIHIATVTAAAVAVKRNDSNSSVQIYKQGSANASQPHQMLPYFDFMRVFARKCVFISVFSFLSLFWKTWRAFSQWQLARIMLIFMNFNIVFNKIILLLFWFAVNATAMAYSIYTLPNGVAVDRCTDCTLYMHDWNILAMNRFQMLSSIELQFY